MALGREGDVGRMTRHGSPRLAGVHEHLERVRLFFGMARGEADAATRFRLMIAAVYSCRAITELILEAAEKQELAAFRGRDSKASRDALEAQIAPRTPFYYLIERIRIHDFHRFGLAAPDPDYRQMTFGGPVRVTARRGMAALWITPQGPVVATAGESHVKLQRPLLVQDGEFFDDETQGFVKLDELLAAFVEKAPGLIEELVNAQA